MAKVVEGLNDLATIYPEIAKQWHPTANGQLLPTKIAPKSNKKYFWICTNGHTFETTADHRVRGSGCPYCGNKKVLLGFNDLKTIYPYFLLYF